MKINDDYRFTTVGDEGVISSVGDKNNNIIIEVNQTGVLILKCIESGCDLESIAERILGEYDIDKEKAMDDARKYIDFLAKKGIIDM